ncbi:MAG: response regulator [Mariniphaga sp.]
MENRKIKILCIDDNPDNLVIIGALLLEIDPGYVVLKATSGREGLELAAAENPEVILLDILMPGMDGYEVCKALKADDRLKNIPVVFITALKGDRLSRVKALECGGEAFLSKPVDEIELAAQINAMLKIKGANLLMASDNERLKKMVDQQTTELKNNYKATLNLLEDLKKENDQRKENELKIIQSEADLEQAQEIACLGSWKWNLESGEVIWSNEMHRIFGINKQNSSTELRDAIKNVIHPDDLHVVLPENAAFVANNAIEYRIILPDHSIRNIWAQSGESVYDDKGNLKFMVGVAQDITERKKMEQELVEAKILAEENDRLKSAFLANMSHEIRTPMNGILGFAELLKEPKLTGEEQLEYIDIINKSGTRMLNIINDIITISKVESGQMKVYISDTDINEQIDYIYTFFKPEITAKGMEFVAKKPLSNAECILSTDREKIYAILTNLVKNAIKFSDKGTIEFGYDVAGSKHTESLQFFVKDNGIGIPKNKQEEIFDRFIQADIGNARAYQGSGLGLSISKAFVEMLGGKIWVESEPGKGSTFYFTVQCNDEKNTISENENFILSKEKMSRINNLKTLIVEDDKTSEILIKRFVKQYSNDILIARTGTEAVEMCLNNPDIQLILMDIQIPEINGYEASRRIRQFNKEVIIIAQTAFALASDHEKALEAGCNSHITKPIQKDKLMNVIHEMFA